MKFLVFYSAVIFFSLSCTAQKSISIADGSQPYEIINNGKEKTLKGLLTRSDIESDSSFHWFPEHYKLGSVNKPAVESFKKHAAEFQLVVFAGTWCEDTHNLLPSFYRLIDSSGYNESNISLIGVDRNMATLNNLSKAFNILNVPTFLVMKDGKEIGRIVEYGKYGLIDKELGEIVAQIK